MSLFGKKERSADDSSASASSPNVDLRENPNFIRVFDEFGREAFVKKEEWRRTVLPNALRKHWDSPDQLYGAVASALEDGFFGDVLDAAEHLRRIDPNRARGSCVYGIVLLKTNRLDEAEAVLRSHLDKYGDDGSVLTSLAKVYSARNQSAKAESTLWHGLEVDPNQDNGLGWYTAIQRERSGETAASDALQRVRSLPQSWRAQLWLARNALANHDLGSALAYYEESLSRLGSEVPSDALMQISGDLGRSGHLRELVELTEPRFVPQAHGLQVGNNLIKAHVDLGEIQEARRVLDQLYALRRPDYKVQLSFWDTEIAKARTVRSKEKAESVSVTFGLSEGPIWLKPSSPALPLFSSKAREGLAIAFLGSTVTMAEWAERIHVQLSDRPGRMSRALPLFLAEQVWFNSRTRVMTPIPIATGQSVGFLLRGVAWKDDEVVMHLSQGTAASDYVVVSHLVCESEPWKVEARLVRVRDHKRLGELVASFSSENPESAISGLAQSLLRLLQSEIQLRLEAPPHSYEVPRGADFSLYLLRMEQLLAIRLAAMEKSKLIPLSGERDILDGALQLSLKYPQNVGLRVLFAEVLLGMKKVRPDVIAEFRERVRLLQEKKPLPQPAQQIIDEMLAGIA